MSKEFDDLVFQSLNVGAYKFKCYLSMTPRDKEKHAYSGACLGGFDSFYRQTLPEAKTVMYEWDTKALVERWDNVWAGQQLGSINMKTLRPLFVRWYKLCRKHGLLPKDFVISKTTRFYLKKFNEMPPSAFFAYIVHLRNVWEEPFFIYNVLVLVEKYKLNIWSAYELASKMSICNSNHHTTQSSAGYPATTLNTKVNLGLMFALKDYFTDPAKKDKRKMEDSVKKQGQWMGWKMHSQFGGYVIHHSTIGKVLKNIKLANKALEMGGTQGYSYLKDKL